MNFACVWVFLVEPITAEWSLYRWLGADVQYPQCISDGDAAVLLWTSDVCISNRGHAFWFGQWLGAYRVPSHCLIQCWQNATDVPYSFVTFVLPNMFMIECIYDVSTEINIFWLDLTWLEMSISSRPQCVNRPRLWRRSHGCGPRRRRLDGWRTLNHKRLYHRMAHLDEDYSIHVCSYVRCVLNYDALVCCR